ncbi:class I adenylate-forming enzyme family protein [Hoeflea sp. CAU 1731]
MRPQNETILGALFDRARCSADDPALTVGQDTLSWGRLADSIARFASSARANGVAPGQRIGILSGNSVEAVVAYLGSIAANCIAVPLPASLLRRDLAVLIEDCSPAMLVANASGESALEGLYDAPVISTQSEPAAPHSFEAFLSAGDPGAQPLTMDPESGFNIIYSSGTTGRPKGIVHDHSMRNRQAARRVFDIGPDSVMLLSTPIYSNTTLMPLLAGLSHGAHVVVMQKFDVEGYLDLAERSKATHTMLVPVQYQRILASPGFDDRDLSSFKVKQSTSAPMPIAVKQDIMERWPGRFVEVYGLTEGGVTLMLDATRYPEKLQTVGRPAPDNDIRVIGENGELLPAGQIGELIGRSPFMMSGYWNRPDATAALQWRAPDGEIYFRSGDLGSFDEEGFVTLQGRKKDMIISGGFNIYPGDLESVLLLHPDVAEAAIVGAASDRWGETPFGFVVPRTDSRIDADALREWANERLGRMQKIAGIALRKELPRSSIGKILKQELARDPALRQVQ